MPSLRALPRSLIAGFVFLFLLALLFVGTSIHYLSTMRHELEGVLYSQMQRINLAHEMRMTIRERMLRLDRIFLEDDPFIRDELFQEFLILGNRFIRLRNNLEPMAVSDAEKQALAEFRAETIRATAVIETVIAHYQQGRMEEGRRLLLETAVPAQDMVIRTSDAVHALYDQRGEATVEHARVVYANALRTVTSLGIAAILLTLLTATLVIRRTLQDRRALVSEIEVRRSAESGLRALGKNLESLVDERTISLQKATELLKEAQHIGQMGHWEWDIPSGNLTWSDQIYRLFGIDPSDHQPSYASFLNALHPEDRTRVSQAVESALKQGDYQVDHRVVRPDGAIRHMREVGHVSYDEQGRPLRMVGTVQDITEEHELREQLWNLAHHDALTGLPNRSLLMDRLQQALHLAQRQGTGLAVALFDLDHFKTVNDSHGHAAGDQLLKEVALRLKGAVRQSDTIARYAGDEFVGLFPGIASQKEARVLLDKILADLAAPCQLSGIAWQISTSIGMAFYPVDANDAEGLLKAADMAMYEAKEAGRNGYRFHQTQAESN